MFPLDQPIDEESGKKIAVWANGGAVVDDTQRHLAALTTSADLDALKYAFECAYKSTRDESARARFKGAYDARKATLSEAVT